MFESAALRAECLVLEPYIYTVRIRWFEKPPCMSMRTGVSARCSRFIRFLYRFGPGLLYRFGNKFTNFGVILRADALVSIVFIPLVFRAVEEITFFDPPAESWSTRDER